MSLLLNIETSSPVCSVCLAENGNLIDYRENTDGNSHARLLTVIIEELLAANKISFTDLSAVAVSSGPGSYTGLRIGVSVAKGLCYSLNIPLISVRTLASIASNIQQKTNSTLSYYLATMDCKRMDAFVAIFDQQGNEVLYTKAVTLNSEFEKEISAFEPLVIGGNALEKCKSIFTSDRFTYVENTGCDSRSMIQLSAKKFAGKEFESVAYFEPFYLKEFEVLRKKVK